jgi:hypothetical protein
VTAGRFFLSERGNEGNLDSSFRQPSTRTFRVCLFNVEDLKFSKKKQKGSATKMTLSMHGSEKRKSSLNTTLLPSLLIPGQRWTLFLPLAIVASAVSVAAFQLFLSIPSTCSPPVVPHCKFPIPAKTKRRRQCMSEALGELWVPFGLQNLV